MRKAALAAGITAIALSALVGMTPAQAAASSQDSTFLADNEQTNLAEQTIGTLALQRAQDSATTALANKTVADHKAAQGKVTAVAQALGVSLPTAPSATQQAQAAQLTSVAASSFDLTYAQIQVAGHQLSIANTEKEISSGTDPSVIAYAQYYLPVAQMHLQMAQAEVAALGGGPSGVPAGTGGQARSYTADRTSWEALAVAGLICVALGALVIRRTRHVA